MKMFDISDFVDVITTDSIKWSMVERFKKRRKEAGLSQKALAMKSAVSYGSIRRFESTGEISLSSLLSLADAIGCLEDFNELFKYEVLTNLKWGE